MKKLFIFLLTAAMLTAFNACALQTNGKTNTETPQEVKATWLYPAYVVENNVSKWGFIDSTGKFVIEPQFENAYDFQDNGLAVVTENAKYGIIDKSGKMLVELKYAGIENYSEGLAVATNNNGTYDVLDEKGKVVFTSTDYLGNFKNGMSVVTKNSNEQYTYGYMDKTGSMVIQPVFKNAYNFDGDRAVVKVDEHKYSIIDSKGNTIKELDYQQIDPPSDGAMAYLDNNGKFGYLDMEGNILIGGRFDETNSFENGYAIVGTGDPADQAVKKFGLIDKKGEYVIKPDYASMNKVGDTKYSVSKESFVSYMDLFSRKAVINFKGELLTGFDYYDIGNYENGIISVSNSNTTFFLDEKGKKVENLPSIPGVGSLTVKGDIIVGQIDNKTLYYTKDGKVLWQPDSTIRFSDGLEIRENKYRPDRGMLIRYPELANMKDEDLQNKLNKKFKKLFVGDEPTSTTENGMITESYDAGYSATENKDLLILEKSDYVYPIGAAHGMPGRTMYHINLKDGSFYALKDLFRKDSDYVGRLSGIIRKQIEEQSKNEDSMYFVDQYEGIKKDQSFVITDKALQIYFYPYEIAAYAAGFPTFDIPYEQISDIIDDKGAFWNSFEKLTVSEQSADAGQKERQMVEETVKSYENGFIDAVNNNDFSKVQDFLYPDSKLYNSQKALAESLFKKGIKENLDKYQVIDVKVAPDSSIKIYVQEEITLKYTGKPSYSGKYNWIYTAKYSETKKAYQLSDIERWNK